MFYCLALSLFSAAYGSSVEGNDAKYSNAFWIAGGIGGGVGKWAPYIKLIGFELNSNKTNDIFNNFDCKFIVE